MNTQIFPDHSLKRSFILFCYGLTNSAEQICKIQLHRIMKGAYKNNVKNFEVMLGNIRQGEIR